MPTAVVLHLLLGGLVCVYTKKQAGVRMGRPVGREGGGDDVNHLMLHTFDVKELQGRFC